VKSLGTISAVEKEFCHKGDKIQTSAKKIDDSPYSGR